MAEVLLRFGLPVRQCERCEYGSTIGGILEPRLERFGWRPGFVMDAAHLDWLQSAWKAEEDGVPAPPLPKTPVYVPCPACGGRGCRTISAKELLSALYDIGYDVALASPPVSDPPPDPLPDHLEAPWFMAADGEDFPAPDPVEVRAEYDKEWKVYRWEGPRGEPQGCAPDQVDWTAIRRQGDEDWLRGAVSSVSPAAPIWVKPVEGGWHVIQGRELPTVFFSHEWASSRDVLSLRADLGKVGWPLT